MWVYVWLYLAPSCTLLFSWVCSLMDLATWTAPWGPTRHWGPSGMCIHSTTAQKHFKSHDFTWIASSVPVRPHQLLRGNLYFWQFLMGTGLPPQTCLHLACWVSLSKFSEDKMNLCVLSCVTHCYPCSFLAQLQISRHFITFKPQRDNLVTSCNLMFITDH